MYPSLFSSSLLLLLPLSIVHAIPFLTPESLTNSVEFENDAGQPTCQNPVSPFDYSAKLRSHQQLPFCDASESLAVTDISALLPRQDPADDYSCGEGRPCKNGAYLPRTILTTGKTKMGSTKGMMSLYHSFQAPAAPKRLGIATTVQRLVVQTITVQTTYAGPTAMPKPSAEDMLRHLGRNAP